MQADDPSDLDDALAVCVDTRLRIRALRPGEDGAIREFCAQLSPRSRYLRFSSPMPAVPDSVVQLLACVDDRRLSLVAENSSGSAGEIVGLGSFCAIDDRSVEVALVVRDDWQRRRVGTELVGRVLKAAEARGFDRFIVHVTAENVAIRRLLKNVGDVVSATMSGASSELVFVRRTA